jgi:hypothetical protein
MSLKLEVNKLYEKTQEELNALKFSLNEKKRTIKFEREIAKNTLRVVEKELSDIEDKLKRISQENIRREDIAETKTMIGEKEKNIDGFNLLSEDELSVIAKNMNKTDYRKYGAPRWLDLENIIKTVVEMKNSYPKFYIDKFRYRWTD